MSKLILLFGILLGNLSSHSAMRKQSEEPILLFDFSQSRSFGTTQKGLTKSMKLKLINRGQGSLKLLGEGEKAGSAQTFSLNLGSCKGVLKPEKFCEVNVTFSPKNEGMVSHRFVILYAGLKDNSKRQLELEVEGRGIPKPCLVSSFGNGGIVETNISFERAIGSRDIIAFDKLGRMFTPGNPPREGVAWARFSPNGVLELNTGTQERRTGDGAIIPVVMSPISEDKVLSAWLQSYFWSSFTLALSNTKGEMDEKFVKEATKYSPTLPVLNSQGGFVIMAMIPILEEGESNVNPTVSASRTQEGGLFLAAKFYGITDDKKQRYEEIPKMPLLLKVSRTGALDPLFGEKGIVRLENMQDKIVALEVSPTGKVQVVQVGLKQNPGNLQVSRYLADGKRDGTFGKEGVATLPETAGPFSPVTISSAIDSEGRLLVAGLVNNTNLCLVRYQDQLDTSFGTGGISCISTPNLFFKERSTRVSLLPLSNGEILVGFNEKQQASSGYSIPQAKVIRLSPNGQLDLSFGKEGRANFDVFNRESELSDLVMRPDGKVLGVAQAFKDSWMGLLLYDPADKCVQGP